MNTPKLYTLEEAKQYLRENLEEGADCPLCKRWAKLNPYSLHHSVARVLIIMYNAELAGECDAQGFLHVEDYLVKIKSTIKGVHGKAKYWELVEQKPNTDPKKKESGLWRLTAKGKLFVKNELSVPKKAMVFNDKAYRFEGDSITIKDALKDLFDYSELMGFTQRNLL